MEKNNYDYDYIDNMHRIFVQTPAMISLFFCFK